ncbi:hypothetical protein [Pontibacter mucosus]|nr:hypothetical protein [Pontibacter mucosus]
MQAMRTAYLIIGVIVLLTSAIACKKDDTVCACKLTGPVDATVEFHGDQAADGCGWLILINSTYHSPVNLPERFQKMEEQKVTLTYTLLDEEYICGFPTPKAPRYKKIKIVDIELK